MTACPVCQGRGWIHASGWPIECKDCTPTKLVRGKVAIDKPQQAALLKRRKEDATIKLRQGFVPEPPFVDDRAPERIYDYD